MHYFFLGNTPALSLLELESVTKCRYINVTPSIVSAEIGSNVLSRVVVLGGLRKVAESVCSGSDSGIHSLLEATLKSIPNKNVAITDYANTGLDKSALHRLKAAITRPIRFVSMETAEHELLMLSHQKVAELNLLPDPTHSGSLVIALTRWIFDAEDWVLRDRNKPYRDIKRGMLPPKVGRILSNLALCGNNHSLYDPFCGTGTVLSEAMLAGASGIFGSDNNPAAVAGTEKNLAWIKRNYQLSAINYQLAVADATHPPFGSVGCIATEPYMGPLLDERNPLTLAKIKDIARGLDKLYRGAYKAWHKILPVGGRVVTTIPSFAVYNQLVPTIQLDSLCSLGYNYISSVAYGKPGATVIRNITILEKI